MYQIAADINKILRINLKTKLTSNAAIVCFELFYFKTMKLIPLISKSESTKYAMVDDDDYDFLIQYKWYGVQQRGENWYAILSSSRYGASRMHRLITNVQKGQVVDHIDHNGLNNQKNNLRVCTMSENCKNTSSRKDSTSKYLGVSFHKMTKKWQASVYNNQTQIYIGLFKNEIDAAKAYNESAKKYHGEFANINLFD